jgi:hypothetical protein
LLDDAVAGETPMLKSGDMLVLSGGNFKLRQEGCRSGEAD